MQEESPPFELRGYITSKNTSFLIRSTSDDKYPLRFETLCTENNQLVKKRNDRSFIPILIHDVDTAGAKPVWKPSRELLYSYSGKDLVKVWFGGLILLYASTEKELLRVLLMARSNITEERKANTFPEAKDESKMGIYWI